jgi:hypothetical protein
VHGSLRPDLEAVSREAVAEDMVRVVHPPPPRGVDGGRRRMVANLLGKEDEAARVRDHLERFSEQRVERLARALGGARVVADDKRRDQRRPLRRVGGERGRVEQVAVLHVLGCPLQEAERLVQPDRQADAAEVLPDARFDRLPQAWVRFVRRARRAGGLADGATRRFLQRGRVDGRHGEGRKAERRRVLRRWAHSASSPAGLAAPCKRSPSPGRCGGGCRATSHGREAGRGGRAGGWLVFGSL